jgi:hypothetical protein
MAFSKLSSVHRQAVDLWDKLIICLGLNSYPALVILVFEDSKLHLFNIFNSVLIYCGRSWVMINRFLYLLQKVVSGG